MKMDSTDGAMQFLIDHPEYKTVVLFEQSNWAWRKMKRSTRKKKITINSRYENPITFSVTVGNLCVKERAYQEAHHKKTGNWPARQFIPSIIEI